MPPHMSLSDSVPHNRAPTPPAEARIMISASAVTPGPPAPTQCHLQNAAESQTRDAAVISAHAHNLADVRMTTALSRVGLWPY